MPSSATTLWLPASLVQRTVSPTSMVSTDGVNVFVGTPEMTSWVLAVADVGQATNAAARRMSTRTSRRTMHPLS